MLCLPGPGANFGDVMEDVVPGVHQPGSQVRASFRSACPRNNVRLESTFLAVERQSGSAADDGLWEVVRQTHTNLTVPPGCATS
jgi:neutral ceramidase